MVIELERIKMETKTEFLRSLYNHGPSFAGAVWDSQKLSPTLTTMQGGGREPMVLECKRLGNIYNDEKFTGGNYGGGIWATDHIAPTMRTGASASQQCIVEIRKIEDGTNNSSNAWKK